MKKEVLINCSQLEHFDFCKWALERIGCKNVKISIIKRAVSGYYVDGTNIELKCIAAKTLFGCGVRYYVVSDSKNIVDALCTLFEGENIYKDWDERERQRKEQSKKERDDLLHSDHKPVKRDWVEGLIVLSNALEPRTPKETKQAKKTKTDKKIASCPKCGSTSLSANKKGFGIGKAIAGAGLGSYLLGTVGLLGAVAGNKGANRLYVTCLKCGHRWKL